MMRNSYQVGIAGMKIARSPDQLCAIGLGSCVGVALYDPAARIGGLIHILLPIYADFAAGNHIRTKFADSGISDLVDEMVAQGASKRRMKAKIAGGAAMFASAGEAIGLRNVESCRQTLRNLGIQLVAQDTGGNKGRTIYFDLETGNLTVRMADGPEKSI